jgi:hypothetical protein
MTRILDANRVRVDCLLAIELWGTALPVLCMTLCQPLGMGVFLEPFVVLGIPNLRVYRLCKSVPNVP